MDLEYFEEEIKEKEEQIRIFEKEIEELEEQKTEYIRVNCQYKNEKENKCDYCGDDLNLGNCYDCSSHLDIGQIKR